MANISADHGRTGGHLPGRSPDPASDILLYRPPQAAAECGIPGDDVGLYIFTGSGGTATYYLCSITGPENEISIWLLDSRLEAAAFILGCEDWELSRLDEVDRERIRIHFPEYFGQPA